MRKALTEITTASTSGISWISHGMAFLREKNHQFRIFLHKTDKTDVRVNRLGPMNWNGEQRSLKTGSNKIRAPREEGDGGGSSTRKQACPSQVALILFCVPAERSSSARPHVGLRDMICVWISFGAEGNFHKLMASCVDVQQ